MKLEKRFFKGLSDDVKYIRETVFVKEQGFQNEFDEYDSKAIHLVIYCDDKATATGRLFRKDDNTSEYTIGRVAVLLDYRKLHLGQKVLEFLEEKAKESGANKIELSAQCKVEGFYKKYGYFSSGEIYYDEFCPHIHMEKNLG